MIDRMSYIPFHIQVSDSIKDHIRTRAWPPGLRLPSELALCNQFNVSRTVVRQALLELEVEGYLVRRRGRGRFVADAKAKVVARLARGLYDFHDEMDAQGLSPSSRLVYRRIVPASAKIANHLNLEIGAPLSEIRQILLVEAQPLAVVSSYLPDPYGLALWNVDLTNRSLYDLIGSKFQIEILRSHLVIEASCVSEEDADLLEISPGDPVIRLEGPSYIDNGRPIEFFEAYQRGDRTCLEVQLVRQGLPGG